MRIFRKKKSSFEKFLENEMAEGRLHICRESDSVKIYADFFQKKVKEGYINVHIGSF